MNIWIDLANSPHVLFFKPVIKELERRKHRIIVTSRHAAQTAQLADMFSLNHTPIGDHGGKKLYNIGFRILHRAGSLIEFMRGYKIDLSMSHNSYAQALASKVLGIPFITLMDYEYQPANHLCFRLAQRVIVPEYFPEKSLHGFGAYPAKTRFYHGLKEQIYLEEFRPKKGFLKKERFPSGKKIVVMRPPASWTLYHHFENPLFDIALEKISKLKDTYIVLLPRISQQMEFYQHLKSHNIFIPKGPLNGPDLLYHSDAVISGGGTMNREAAILGTPTFSIYQGKMAAVDKYLIKCGRMIHLSTEKEIESIKIEKKAIKKPLEKNKLLSEVIDLILN